MKTIQEIAQWVIDNRYPKNENDKVSDFEMYQFLIEAMNQVLRQPPVSGSLCEYCNDDKTSVCCQDCLDEMINKAENTQ